MDYPALLSNTYLQEEIGGTIADSSPTQQYFNDVKNMYETDAYVSSIIALHFKVLSKSSLWSDISNILDEVTGMDVIA